MRIVLIGADGQLGSDLARALKNHETMPLTLRDLDIQNHEKVRELLVSERPQAVVNTAAFHNVPKCEEDPAAAFAVNATASRNLARVCLEIGASLCHVSTDYVFDGGKGNPYLETDPAWPLNVYGVSKLAGECLIRAEMEKFRIVRTSGLYGKSPCLAKGGDNFVRLMLRLARERDELRVVADERLTPTWTLDLAEQIAFLLETEVYGLFHATCEGDCSWYEFALEIFRISDVKVKVHPTTAAEFGASVRRPSYSVLENRALKDAGLHCMRDWKTALRGYLEEIGEARV